MDGRNPQLRGTGPGPSFRRLAKLRIPLPTLRADFRALSLRRKRRPDHQKLHR